MIPLQLTYLIEVETPQGRGHAILVEAGPHDYFWTVALRDTGALVTFTQDRIRIAKSYTHRRGMTDQQMRRAIMKGRPK